MSASGATELFVAAVSLVSAVAAVTDLLRGRIFNWLTAPALLAGIAYGTWQGGASGVLTSLAGAGLGLLLFGWMFWLGAMGGGDVKLLMALGAWGGPRYALETALLAVLLGGVMAVFSLSRRGRIRAFLSGIKRFVLSVVIKELEIETPKVDHKLTLPFGVPIGIAAVWTAVAAPLQQWGVSLWPQ